MFWYILYTAHFIPIKIQIDSWEINVILQWLKKIFFFFFFSPNKTCAK